MSNTKNKVANAGIENSQETNLKKSEDNNLPKAKEENIKVEDKNTEVENSVVEAADTAEKGDKKLSLNDQEQINIDDLNKFQESMKKSVNAINKLTKINEDLNKKIELITETHQAEINALKERMPQIREESKIKVEGYFDFDTSASKHINEQAISDKQRAFADFNIINNWFK